MEARTMICVFATFACIFFGVAIYGFYCLITEKFERHEKYFRNAKDSLLLAKTSLEDIAERLLMSQRRKKYLGDKSKR